MKIIVLLLVFSVTLHAYFDFRMSPWVFVAAILHYLCVKRALEELLHYSLPPPSSVHHLGKKMTHISYLIGYFFERSLANEVKVESEL